MFSCYQDNSLTEITLPAKEGDVTFYFSYNTLVAVRGMAKSVDDKVEMKRVRTPIHHSRTTSKYMNKHGVGNYDKIGATQEDFELFVKLHWTVM